MNKCDATKQKAVEADEIFRELGRQGLLTAVEPAWKRRWIALAEVSVAVTYSQCMYQPRRQPQQGNSESSYDFMDDNQMQEDPGGVSHIFLIVSGLFSADWIIRLTAEKAICLRHWTQSYWRSRTQPQEQLARLKVDLRLFRGAVGASYALPGKSSNQC